MVDKLAIITSGGGTKCSFGAGVMLALAEIFGIKEPEILISGSGSAGTGSYFTAKQYDSIRNIWGNLLSTSKFINYSRFWRIIDIDYLIDVIFKEQDPLNIPNIHNSPTHYLIPALNRQTGKIDYLSNKDKVDIFEAMRATKAMPIAFKFNPHIVINGSTYCDSELSSSAEIHFEKAVDLGAKKILVVANTYQDNLRDFEHRMFDLWVCCQDNHFRESYSQAVRQAREYQPYNKVNILWIRPQNKIKISNLSNNRDLLRATMQQGYDETSNNPELVEFLK